MGVLLVRGDARNLPLADATVDLVVTSPPFYALRSYTDGGEHYDGQIGAEKTPAEYVDNLLACTREWVRVLKPSGSLWVNLGDKYTGGGGFAPDAPSNVARRAGAASATFRGAVAEHKRQGAAGGGGNTYGFRPKTLIGLPWRYALRCIDELGLILRAEVIWSKPNGLPESVTDRVRRSHEQWFWLTRWAPDVPAPADLVRAVLEQVAGGTLAVDEAERLLTVDVPSHEAWFHMTRSPRYYSAVDTIRTPVSGYERPRNADRGMRDSTTKRRTLADTCNPLGALPGSVWTIATQPLKVPAHLDVDHFAAFPMEWPRRIVQGWSPSGVCTGCGEGRRPVASVEQKFEREWNRNRAGFIDLNDDGFRESGLSGTRATRTRRETTITGARCACPDTSAPTRPAVVLDPFGGTGTTALVAAVLGRTGISVDMSADYCRLAQWRTADPGERAAAMVVPRPERPVSGQDSLFDMEGFDG